MPRSKPVWFTEFSWSTHPDHTETPDWARGVSPQQQADFFAETIELLDDQYPEVTQVFWYNLRDREDGSDRHQANFGMLEHDLSPKPVLDRMREVLDRR